MPVKENRNKFLTLDYLKNGDPKQRQAWDILAGGIFGFLALYDPVLAGTIPIGISVDSSDLDIICRAADRNAFRQDMLRLFGSEDGFSIWENKEKDAVVCSFARCGMRIEIFGSGVEPCRSDAFRHMLVEDRILKLGGDGFREKVMDMKCRGVKTEPAFARLLGLGDGDPYKAVLKLEVFNDAHLACLISDSKLIKNNVLDFID